MNATSKNVTRRTALVAAVGAATSASEVVEMLSRAAKKRATEAIDKLHQDYYAKGGIRDTTDKLREQVETTSSHIFGLAKFATKQADGDLEKAAVIFSAMCVFAEEHYKKQHEVENLKDALPVWATFKSNILGSIRMDLSPLEYKSEYELRQARMEKIRPAALTSPDTGKSVATPQVESQLQPLQRQTPRAGPIGLDEIDQWLGSTAIHDSLRVLLSNVILSVEYIRRSKVGDAEAILRETGERLNGLVDKRKLNQP